MLMCFTHPYNITVPTVLLCFGNLFSEARFHLGMEVRVCQASITPLSWRTYIDSNLYMLRSARFSVSTLTGQNQMSVVMVCQKGCSVEVDQAVSTMGCHKRNTSLPLGHQLKHVRCSV